MGWYHSTDYSLKSGVTGDFHRPYATLMILAYTIQRTTLPQSALAGCQLPQRGSREWLSPFNRVLAKIRGCGRFSSPLRSSDEFGSYRSMGGTRVYPKLSFSPWETLWHRSRKVSWLMVATEEGSCTGPVAMVPFSPGRVPPAREAAHRSRAYRAA